MTRLRHPPLPDWIAMLAGTVAAERARPLNRHLRRCDSCAADVRVLKELGAMSDEPWGALPRAARLRARVMPRGLPTPALAARRRTLRLAPADVRSVAGVVASPRAGRVLARSVPGADLSVMVAPPDGEGLWRIRGRIWLRPPRPIPSRVILTHDDHVMADVHTDTAGRFRLEEVLVPGFCLEIHLPEGSVVELRDAR